MASYLVTYPDGSFYRLHVNRQKNGLYSTNSSHYNKDGYYQAQYSGTSKDIPLEAIEKAIEKAERAGITVKLLHNNPAKKNPAKHHRRNPEKDTEITRVIFRRFKDENKEVIAFFPDQNYKNGVTNRGNIMSYMHIGQHGEANVGLIKENTKPANIKEPDVAALYRELESIGYNLKVVKR